MHKLIKLTKGEFAIVDGEDWIVLNQWLWHCVKGYAVRAIYDGSKRIKVLRMHRLILNCPDGKMVDHINRNKLDNRKENLRICSNIENTINSKRRADNTSGFKGVNKKKWRDNFRWCARITVNKKRIQLGYYKTAKEAALSYDEAAKKCHGEFARLNFP